MTRTGSVLLAAALLALCRPADPAAALDRPTPSAPQGAVQPDAVGAPMPFEPTPELLAVGQLIGRRPGGTDDKADAIVDYIFKDAEGLRFEYRRYPTLTAAEAFEHRAGNCLTLVNLFIALARSAGLDAFPLEVEDFVSFARHGDTVLRSTHMISGIDVGGSLWTIDFAPDSPKAYRRLSRVNDLHHAALHYNSVAAEAMLDHDTERADALFRRAIALGPRMAEPMSNYGVFARWQGDDATAEERFLAALELEPSFLPALNNLAGLYRVTGRPELARKYEELGLEAKYQNPYYLIKLAVRRLGEGELEEAQVLLQRVRRIDHEIPDLYLVLGRLDLARGKVASAKRHFAEARRRSGLIGSDFRHSVDRKIDRLLQVARTG